MCSFVFFLLIHYHERNPKTITEILITKTNTCELFSYHALVRKVSLWQRLKVNEFSKKSGKEFLPLAFSLSCQVWGHLVEGTSKNSNLSIRAGEEDVGCWSVVDQMMERMAHLLNLQTTSSWTLLEQQMQILQREKTKQNTMFTNMDHLGKEREKKTWIYLQKKT